MSKPDIPASEIARIVALAEKFNGKAKGAGATPAAFIKPAIQAGLITTDGLAKHLGVNKKQVMRLVNSSGNRDLHDVADMIANAGRQRLTPQ